MYKLLVSIFILFILSCNSSTEPEPTVETPDPPDPPTYQPPRFEVIEIVPYWNNDIAPLYLLTTVKNTGEMTALNAYCSRLVWKDSLGVTHTEDKNVKFWESAIPPNATSRVDVPLEHELSMSHIITVNYTFKFEY